MLNFKIGFALPRPEGPAPPAPPAPEAAAAAGILVKSSVFFEIEEVQIWKNWKVLEVPFWELFWNSWEERSFRVGTG